MRYIAKFDYISIATYHLQTPHILVPKGTVFTAEVHMILTTMFGFDVFTPTFKKATMHFIALPI